MQDIIELIMSNQIYMIAAAVVALFLIIFLIKKVFKMAMIGIAMILVYVGYLYMTEDDPLKSIQAKLDKGKSAVSDIDDATRDMRREGIDQVIDEVDKKLKEASKKK